MCPRSFGPKWLKSWPIGQGIWPAGHPQDPLVSGLCTLSSRVTYIPRVTLILVKFQISLSFLEMLQFSTYVPELK
jgi:hypothetical protein